MNGEPIVILLAEDDDAHAAIVARIFADFRVANRMFRVADGEAALDYLYQRNAYGDPASSPRPGIILLDLRMPKIDGLEVLKAIKTDPGLKTIPVVVLTTSKGEQDIAEAYEHHANSYLVKPVDFAKFTRLLENFGSYWLACNEYPQGSPKKQE